MLMQSQAAVANDPFESRVVFTFAEVREVVPFPTLQRGLRQNSCGGAHIASMPMPGRIGA
jgi:hypothetical protein